jgi:hypothetical protein
MTQEDYIRKLCQTRVIDTNLELELRKLLDHKAEHGEIPVYETSPVIDMLKTCPEKGKLAQATFDSWDKGRAAAGLSVLVPPLRRPPV